MNQIANNRVLWIDWAKAIGIVIVVFCHTPQEPSFFRTFCFYFQMPLFFFVSGYLHKNQASFTGSLLKYNRSIIIPFLILQVLNYPYWLFKYYAEQEGTMDFASCFLEPFGKCFVGTPIAGPTWYVCSIFMMKLITDAINRTRYADVITIILILGAIVTGCCVNYYPLDHQINFTVLSTINFLPFFYLGYYAKKYGIISCLKGRYGCLAFVICVFLLFFDGYITYPNRFLFYFVGFFSVVAFLSLIVKISVYSRLVELTSRGTILILGLHWMFIGTTNYIIEKLLHVDGITYPTFMALLISILIVLAIDVFVLFCEKHFRIILGGR